MSRRLSVKPISNNKFVILVMEKGIFGKERHIGWLTESLTIKELWQHRTASSECKLTREQAIDACVMETGEVPDCLKKPEDTL